MKVEQLDITQWQSLLARFSLEKKDHRVKPAALRIENTQLTIARHYGGINLNNHHYRYFEPLIPNERNEDNTPKVAWLLVSEEFLSYAKRAAKDMGKDTTTTEDSQLSLGL